MSFTVFGVSGYALAAAAGVLVYFTVGMLLLRQKAWPAKGMPLFALFAVALGLFCSRLLFCLFDAECFEQVLYDPLYFFTAPWDLSNSMTGLLLGVLLAAELTATITKFSFGRMMDAAVLPMGLFLFVLRLAEGPTEQLGIGRQIDAGALTERLPFLFVTEKLGTMELYRLAVFRYEAVFALILFSVILTVSYKAKHGRAGDLALLFFALYGAGQVLFESMRDDGHMVLGFIRIQQVAALAAVLLVLGLVSRRYGRLLQARGTVTTAWVLLPVAVFILWIMAAPINHVLDLSGHIPLGSGLLLLIGLYLAFFLRSKGADPRLIVTWLIAVLAMIACVLLEFAMDASLNILRDYTLLALSCAVLFCCPCTLYRALTRLEAAA